MAANDNLIIKRCFDMYEAVDVLDKIRNHINTVGYISVETIEDSFGGYVAWLTELKSDIGWDSAKNFTIDDDFPKFCPEDGDVAVVACPPKRLRKPRPSSERRPSNNRRIHIIADADSLEVESKVNEFITSDSVGKIYDIQYSSTKGDNITGVRYSCMIDYELRARW